MILVLWVVTQTPYWTRYKDEDYKYAWEKEYMERYKRVVLANTMADIECFGQTMQEVQTKPEYEIVDIRWLCAAHSLLRNKGGFCSPRYGCSSCLAILVP